MHRSVRAAIARGAWLVPALLLAPAAGAVLAAPVPSHDKRFTLDDAAPGLATVFGRTKLCLVRELIVRKNPMPPERLYLDEKPLGLLPQQTFVVTEVDPGFHRLEGVLDCPALVIECRPGDLVLLRLREVIDERDIVRARWLLDDPSFATDLIAQWELRRAEPTVRGVQELIRRWRNVNRSLPPDTVAAPPDTAATLAFDEMLFEHPLDPLNYRRDFSIYSGRIEIAPGEIRYSMEKKRRDVRVTIRFQDVVSLRFGGTRSTGMSPWIDLFYRSEGETLGASFTSAGGNPEAAYNRIFGAIRARWEARRARGPRAGSDGGP